MHAWRFAIVKLPGLPWGHLAGKPRPVGGLPDNPPGGKGGPHFLLRPSLSFVTSFAIAADRSAGAQSPGLFMFFSLHFCIVLSFFPANFRPVFAIAS